MSATTDDVSDYATRASVDRQSSAPRGDVNMSTTHVNTSPPTDPTATTVQPHQGLRLGKVGDPVEPMALRRLQGLRSQEVASFIINKMVGSGVFSVPLISYKLTGSKGITIALWVAAYVHTLMNMLLYLDYSSVFPFTGGELVYLLEVTASKVTMDSLPFHRITRPQEGDQMNQPSRSKKTLVKLFGDGMLCFTSYAIMFVLLFSSASNAKQFGRLVLIIGYDPPKNDEGNYNPPTAVQKDYSHASDLEEDLIAFIAFTLLCLIHYWFPSAGRFFNVVTAGCKILMLLVIIGVSAGGNGVIDDKGLCLAMPDVPLNDTDGGFGWFMALLSILFSFQGWENATFVAGEASNTREFQKGFMFAVIGVGLLYIGAVIALVLKVDVDDLDTISAVLLTNYLPIFTGCSRASTAAWAAIAAFSCLGSVNSIIYTFSRVKQAIGHANILPFSSFWASEHLVRTVNEDLGDPRARVAAAVDSRDAPDDPRPDLQSMCPQGGLALHWIVTTIMIVVPSLATTEIVAVRLAGLYQTYSHMLVLAVLGLLWFRLSTRERDLTMENRGDDRYRLTKMAKSSKVLKSLIYVSVSVYSLFNIVILILPGLTYQHDRLAAKVQAVESWGLPTMLLSVLIFSWLYYLVVFGNAEVWFYDLDGHYTGRTGEHRDKWVVRQRDNRYFPSLEPPSDDSQKGMGPLIRHPLLSPLYWVRRKVVIIKEIAFTGNSEDLARVSHYGQRFRVEIRTDKKKD